MPRIPGYDQQVLPQGFLPGQASPGAFGAQVGGALGNLGAGMGEAAQRLNQVEEDQGRIWAYDASATTFENLKKGFTEKVNGLDPNDPEFTTKVGGLTDEFNQQIEESKQNLVNQAPSRSARKIVASHMSTNQRALLNYAMGEQARITGEYTAKLVNDSVKGDQDAMAADPTNDNFDRILSNRSESIGGLQTVDPTLKIKWQDAAKHNLAITQVQSMASRDAQGFLGLLGPLGGSLTRGGKAKGAAPAGAPEAPVPAPGPAEVFSRMIGVESGGYQGAISKKGAVGVAQVMPGTGPEAAQLAGLPWDEGRFRSDATYNRQLGAAYFNQQLQANNGDVTKAVAAYNMGPTKLAGLIGKYGEDWLAHAPAETQGYVKAVLGAQQGPAPAAASALVANEDDPQVRPMTDAEVQTASPDIAGWKFLIWQEKVAAVRQAEAIVGGKLATDRGLMDKELRDVQATLMAGKAYPGLDDPRFGAENLTRLYGPDEGKRRFDQLVYDKQVGGFIGQMAKMPWAQAEAMLQSLAPAGGPEFAAKAPLFNQAYTALNQLQVVRNKDFAQWALDTGIPGAKPVDFSSVQSFQDTITNRIPVANAGLRDYQVNAHLLSGEEAGRLGDLLSRMTPASQLSYLKGLQQATSGSPQWFRDTLAQVAPKNTTLAYAAQLAQMPGAVGGQDANTVAQMVLEGAHVLQGRDLDDPTKVSRALRLEDGKISRKFWDYVGPKAFDSPDAQRSAAIANDVYQAVKNYLAAAVFRGSVNPMDMQDADVHRAINAITGGMANIGAHGDKVFLPWGMDDRTFQGRFNSAVQVAIRDSGLKGTVMDNPDGFHYQNVGDGKYLVTNGNRPLVGKDGRTVVADVYKPAPIWVMKD